MQPQKGHNGRHASGWRHRQPRVARRADERENVAIENRQAIAIVRSEIEKWGDSKFAQIVKGTGAAHVAYANGKEVRYSGLAAEDGDAAGLKLTMVTKTTRSKKIGHSWRVAPADWIDDEASDAPADPVVVPLKSKKARF